MPVDEIPVQIVTLGSGSAAALTPTFSAGATAGNIIHLQSQTNGVNETFTLPGAFDKTQDHVAGGTFSAIVARKIATGGETAETISFGAVRICGGIMIEFSSSGLDSVPFDGSSEDAANITAVTTSQSSGSFTNTVADALIIASFFGEIANNIADGRSYTAGYTERAQDNIPSDWRPVGIVATRVAASIEPQSCTFNTTDVGDEMYGVITVFKGVSTGASIPLTGTTVTLTTAAGTISTSVPVSGNSASLSSANGSMSATIQMDAALVSKAITTAALAAGMQMSGGLIQNAISTGNLSIRVAMDGTAISEAASAATITTSDTGNLSGTMPSTSSTDSVVTANIPMTGATLTSSNADSNLSTIQPLAGASASVSSLVGALHVTIDLSASIRARSLMDGTLTIRMAMDGATITEAANAGLFTLGGDHRLPPPERLNVTSFERRIERIPFENRLRAS